MEQEEIDDFTDAAKQNEKENQEEEIQEDENPEEETQEEESQKGDFLCTFCVFKLFDWFLDWQYLSKANIS